MRIKARPDEFMVRELSSWTPDEKGPVSVYSLRKKKLDTFSAIRRLASAAQVPLDAIHYVGLKDRQAVTTQLISVAGGHRLNPNQRIPGLSVRYMGRTSAPLSSADLQGNAFRIVVRDLSREQLERLETNLPAVVAHGMIHYFDDQRFGSLTAGQGMPGRALAKGDPEEALRDLIATPGRRDPPEEKRFKTLVRRTWGDWEVLARKWGTRRGKSMVQHLVRKPGDYAGAWQRCPGRERAIHVFAYQSLIWNESVRRYLDALLPSEHRFATPYAGGMHVWPSYGPDETPPPLPETFPLIDHTSQLPDPAMRAAVEQALAAEGLTVETFKIPEIPGCFFKHEERPLVVRPEGIELLGGSTPDEMHPGRSKVTLEFALPPGAYATLLLKRLFGSSIEEGRGRPARDDRRRGPRRPHQGRRPRGRR
ncbi:MAG: tRNA pseudouridine(13) synthase TruD [Planctomycetes bacterium]|nr:tRNA pseudouridine(13) synthase TruD [Planctomycetota bacterium]